MGHSVVAGYIQQTSAYRLCKRNLNRLNSVIRPRVLPRGIATVATSPVVIRRNFIVANQFFQRRKLYLRSVLSLAAKAPLAHVAPQ